MNSKKLILTSALALTILSASCFAQSNETASTNLVPNQTIYVPRIPTPSELAKVASAQGSSIGQIVQTADSITIQYKMANGQSNVVAYRSIASIEGGTESQASVATPTTPAPAYVQAPSQQTVIYTEAPTYYTTPYYYGYPHYYDPWYGPVHLSLGFGWYHGWHHAWR
jgi:hypothetical protein